MTANLKHAMERLVAGNLQLLTPDETEFLTVVRINLRSLTKGSLSGDRVLKKR